MKLVPLENNLLYISVAVKLYFTCTLDKCPTAVRMYAMSMRRIIIQHTCTMQDEILMINIIILMLGDF